MSIQQLFNVNTESNLSWCHQEAGTLGDHGLGGGRGDPHITGGPQAGQTRRRACRAAASCAILCPPHPVEVLAKDMAISDLKTPNCVLLGGNEMPARQKAIEILGINYVHQVPKTQCVILRALQADTCPHPMRSLPHKYLHPGCHRDFPSAEPLGPCGPGLFSEPVPTPDSSPQVFFQEMDYEPIYWATLVPPGSGWLVETISKRIRQHCPSTAIIQLYVQAIPVKRMKL